MMDKHTDLVVVGAGPAGLAAACAARSCGLEVTLLDEQAAPGGQLLRHVESPLAQTLMAPPERLAGLRLVEEFRQSGARYVPQAVLWGMEDRRLCFSVADQPQSLSAANVILAPGGMERPVPFPGWTLPGVMGAGGADILLRSGGSLTADKSAPVVLAGNGPLLLLLAGHLLDAGVRIAAWLDTGRMAQRLSASLAMPAALLDPSYLGKGLRMALRVLKAKVPIIRNVRDIRAVGAARLEKVAFTTKGQEREIPAAALLRHEGIIPRTQICNALGARLRWDNIQRCWYAHVDANGLSSVDDLYVAGDGAYVHGGDASRLKGWLAGIDAARRLHVISADEARRRSAAARRQLAALRAGRAFLRSLFAPDPEIFNVPDETLVCRCECVSAGDIRKAVAEGFREVNEVKRVTRCGMGQCQGRMCGPALAEITAAAQGARTEAVGLLHMRSPFRPVSLQQYCDCNAPR